MRRGIGIVLGFAAITGCAGGSPTPAERNVQDVAVTRTWLRGPMMETCTRLPGPESRKGCVLALDGTLARLRGDHLTRDDHFRIELARAKGADELRRLWTRTEHEAWLRGIRTAACQRAPYPATARRCLDGIEAELVRLGHPDEFAGEQPAVRAKRAVARIETREQARAIEQQRPHEHEFSLVGLGAEGGQVQPSVSLSVSKLPVVVKPVQPGLGMPVAPLSPPISCTSRMVGGVVHTDCY
ncbi:MAG: hypothetical protein P0111_07080 [Nitrospira sp.]|nr:hypothetical protein [Nitrospira sp.]